MDTQPPPPGEKGLNTGKLWGATSNKTILVTQQECRHRIIHRDKAYAAAKHLTQDAHLKIMHKTGSSTIKK
jgi:hypothetical protein